MSIGLKGSWKETKTWRLKHRLRELKWNLKYAWQRAWRGWDSRDMFNMDISFIERYKEILKYFRKHHHGLFNIPLEYQQDFNNRLHFNEEETDAIIDMMIYHLEMMDEDNVEKVVYGTNVYDDDYDFTNYTLYKCKRINSIMQQNKKAFMKLFDLFFFQLWD